MEIWKSVKGFEGLYEVSNLGRVKSLDRIDSLGRSWVGRILKSTKAGGRYSQVGLHKDGSTKNSRVHVLVAVAFLNHKPDGFKIVVDHINNDSLDNRLDNLRLCSNRENTTKDLKGGTSSYVGVCWSKSAQEWMATIKINGESRHLGYYDNEVIASMAYETALNALEVDEIAKECGVELPYSLGDIIGEKHKPASKFKGVSFNKAAQKWRAAIKTNGVANHLGTFKTELQASEAYQEALKKVLVNKQAQESGEPSPFTLDDIYKPRATSSQFKGVYFSKASQRWAAQIAIQGKTKHIGYFKTEIEAFEVREKFKIENKLK